MRPLLRPENGLTTDIFVVKCTGRGLVVKRPGVLSKVQMLNLVLGVGVFSPLPIRIPAMTPATAKRGYSLVQLSELVMGGAAQVLQTRDCQTLRFAFHLLGSRQDPLGLSLVNTPGIL